MGWQETLVEFAAKILRIERRLDRLETIEAPTIGGGGVGAPNDAQYVTLALDAGLTAERVLTEGADVDLVDTGPNGTITVGRGGDKILLFDSGGNPVAEYAATDVGLDAASAAATSGDVVTISQNASLTADHTLTAGVEYWFAADVVVSGKLTCGNGTTIHWLNQSRSADDGNDLLGIVGPATGECHLIQCTSLVQQNGDGDAIVLDASAGGNIIAEDCTLEGYSEYGSGYVGKLTGDITLIDGAAAGNTDIFDSTPGAETLIFEDNFTGVALDPAKWTVVQNTGGTITVAGGIFQIVMANNSASTILETVANFNNTSYLRVEARMKVEGSNPARYYFNSIYFGGNPWSSVGFVNWHSIVDYESAIYTGGASQFPPRTGSSSSGDGSIIADPAGNTWFVSKFKIPVGDFLSHEYDSAGETFSNLYQGQSGNHKLGLYFSVPDVTYGDTSTVQIDYVRVYAPAGVGLGHTHGVRLGKSISGISVYANPGNPLFGDRAVFDALNYPERHTNDTDDPTGIHHSLDELDARYAAPGQNVEEITDEAIAGATYINGQYQREAAIVSWLHETTLWHCYTYWDKDGYLSFAVKRSTDTTWTIYTTAIQIGAGWSSHETISLGIDQDGYLHVAYDMHNEALKYRKSTLPLDQFAGVLTAVLPMLGTNENAVTYPVFVMSPAGKLFVLFRNGAGGSGDADTFFYAYDEGTATWSAATGTGAAGILLGGHSDVPTHSAYFFIPVFDDNFGSGGYMHLAWTWCNAGPGYTEHDIGYARWDGTSWTQIGGGAQTVPILSTNDDHALTLSGNDLSLMSRMAVDSHGYPHIVYNQNDGTADWHRHYLYWNGAAWTDIVITAEHITNTGGAANIDLAIDPTTNIAYYLYVDALAPDGLNVLTSSDYVTWEHLSIYSTDLGLFCPAFDKYMWRTHHKLLIPMAEWFPAGTQWHVYLIEWNPDEAVRDHTQLPGVHTHATAAQGGKLAQANTHESPDTDAATSSLHHTIGVTATTAAAGNHTHTSGQYRQFVYVVSGGDFSFVIDGDGNPIFALQDLE